MPTQADSAAQYVELALESVLLRVGDHVGVFYRGDEERNAFVMPLVATALAAGCGVIFVCDRNEPEEVAKQLTDLAIDSAGALGRGQIRLIPSTDAYLAGGVFEPDRVVEFYQRAWRESRRRGYPVLCVIGEMSWSLRDCPGTERLLEYEARYADEFETTPAITLCLYDLQQTSGDQILDLLRLHRRVVLNGIEIQNPHVDRGFFLDGSAGGG